MEKDKAKVIEIVGTASERAGTYVGKAATLGKKIAGVATGSVSAGKGMPDLAKEDTKPVPEKKNRNSKATVLKSNLLEAQQKLAETQKEAQQTQSQLESQIETLQERNNSLVSELEQAISEIKEITAIDGAIRARVAALESELNAAQQQLEQVQSKTDNPKSKKPVSIGSKTKLEADLAATRCQMEEIQDKAKKTQSQFESRLEYMQAEKDSLLSDLEKARNEANEITSQQESVNRQVAALEFELTTARNELQEVQSRAESTQTELKSQVEKLQLEKESLNSELQTALSQLEEAKARENVMKTKTAALESEVTILRIELSRARESESDNNAIQTEGQNSYSKVEEEVKEPATAPAETEDAESSKEVVAGTNDDQTNERDQEEAIGVNVESVEEPELKSESHAQFEVTPAHPAEVTVEDVQAADFKKGMERILFSKALSDFASQDATTRADAAATIAGIHHELSPRLLISHMADEPSARVRQECIKALSALESKEGLSAIEQALADEAASVRLAAVWGLYRLAGTESIPALTRMLSDKDASVRRRAVTCIGWLGGQIS